MKTMKYSVEAIIHDFSFCQVSHRGEENQQLDKHEILVELGI